MRREVAQVDTAPGGGTLNRTHHIQVVFYTDSSKEPPPSLNIAIISLIQVLLMA